MLKKTPLLLKGLINTSLSVILACGLLPCNAWANEPLDGGAVEPAASSIGKEVVPMEEESQLEILGEDQGPAIVSSETYSGVTYTLYSDGLLEITGSGKVTKNHCPDAARRVVVGEGIIAISSEAFKAKAIETVELSSTVVQIASSAFYNCTRLTRIDIPASKVAFGYDAFCGCNKLNEITIMGSWSGLHTSYGYAFYKSYIEKINISCAYYDAYIDDSKYKWIDLSVATCFGEPVCYDVQKIHDLSGGREVVDGISGSRCVHCGEFVADDAPYVKTPTDEQWAARLKMQSVGLGTTTLDEGKTHFSFTAPVTDRYYISGSVKTFYRRDVTDKAFTKAALDAELSGCSILLQKGETLMALGEGWESTSSSKTVIIEAATGKDLDGLIDAGRQGNVGWAVTSDGTLYITGEGDMPDYGYAGPYKDASSLYLGSISSAIRDRFAPPWTPYCTSFTKVIVEEGITAVGAGSFSTVQFSATVGGSYRTYIFAINEIELASSVERIGAQAFRDSVYGEFEIPGTVHKV